MTKPMTVVKCVGPKLVPFFKTVAIFFVLYREDSQLESFIYCIFKCLPIISLIIFVLLHGMNFTEAYSYSRKVLIGLIFSMVGDICLVWKNVGYFIPGVSAFAIAQLLYSLAFGFRPFKVWRLLGCSLLSFSTFLLLLPGLNSIMIYVVGLYLVLIGTMLWRAVARVQFLNDMWTWTKMCSWIGAVCFATSDFLIAYDKFCAPVPYAHQLIMLTYYGAQLGISLSVVDSQADQLLKKTA